LLSSPAVANGRVYIGQSGSYPRTKILALDAATGASIWNYTTGATIVSCPAIADGKVYASSTDRKIYALNASTGDLLWSYQTGGSVRSSPSIAEGRLFIGSDDGKIYAFSSLPTPNYPAFVLTTNSTTVFRGAFFRLTGTLSAPKTSPPNITLQWSTNGSGFMYQQDIDKITNGMYTRDIAFSAPGTYQFRAIWPGDATSNSATSNTVTVTVLDVIPEFTPIILLSILMSLTLTIVLLSRKRKHR
jgi:hypothetical protein